MQLRTDHIRLKVASPRMSAKNVWVVLFEFKLYLMNVRICEEYTLDDNGLIVKLKRSMGGAKELLVARG